MKVTDFKKWSKLAKVLDQLEGMLEWKLDKETHLYDFEKIELRFKYLKKLRKKGNLKSLIACVKQNLVKNIGNISEPELYNKCNFGTKKVVEDFHNEIIICLQKIYYAKGDKISISDKIKFFAEARHSYGHTALMLSGGASFAKFHAGVVHALYEQDLLPRIICGSSAGALVCAMICSRPYSTISDLCSYEMCYPFPQIENKPKNIFELLTNMLQGKSIMNQAVFKKFTQHFTGDLTFKEIYDQFGWNLNITATDYTVQSDTFLMNYLTTPSVLVWSAVLASIAAPGLFDKVELMRKNDRGETKPYFPSFTRQRYVDGSIANDLPMKRISELFNVNTFIVSQVNPHVVPFISVDFGAILDTGLWKQFIKLCKTLVGTHINYWISNMNAMGFIPSRLNAFANGFLQNYSGHVTIVPDPTWKDYTNLLSNVTKEDYIKGFQAQYLQTQLKMAHIRSYFGIEREFNRYYDRLRNQLRDLPHPELDADPYFLDYAAKRTFDRKNVWNSSSKSAIFNDLAEQKFKSSMDDLENPASPEPILLESSNKPEGNYQSIEHKIMRNWSSDQEHTNHSLDFTRMGEVLVGGKATYMNPNNFLSEYSQELEPPSRYNYDESDDDLMSMDEDNMCANLAADIENYSNYSISDIKSMNLQQKQFQVPDFNIN